MVASTSCLKINPLTTTIMETKTVRPYRNNANISIIVPQYVNLEVNMFGFRVTVTLNCDEPAFHWIECHKYNVVDSADQIHTFQKCGKKTGIRHYVTIVREYQDLNKIQQACWMQAAKDLKDLKILIREAKVARLNDEINDLNNNYDNPGNIHYNQY